MSKQVASLSLWALVVTLGLSTSVEAQEIVQGTKILCESSLGFSRGENRTEGHRFYAEIQTSGRAALLDNGRVDISDLPRSIRYTIHQESDTVYSLVFSRHSRMMGVNLIVPAIRFFTEKVFVAESAQALTDYLLSIDGISDFDAKKILDANVQAASVVFTHDFPGTSDESLPGRRTVFGYNLCRISQ